jgi:hypothetical protein
LISNSCTISYLFSTFDLFRNHVATFLAHEITIFVWFQIVILLSALKTGMNSALSSRWRWINDVTAFFTHEITVFVFRQIIVIVLTVVAMIGLKVR